MKIYLASSWRNTYQPDVLDALRASGFEVYDFRNPKPGNTGFSWRKVDPDLHSNLNPLRMQTVLAHPVSQAGFDLDIAAMRWADACVLLLPCGMSAHLEAGWFAGAGKPVFVLAQEIREPKLMYKCFDDAQGNTPIFATIDEVITRLLERR